mmetsp:Transcript_40044/g.66920  ORF Transcript_40044/g.66920 Transcript_40044/m.66920 type:complete len:417 (-) Transcript_40044:310-1560(-)
MEESSANFSRHLDAMGVSVNAQNIKDADLLRRIMLSSIRRAQGIPSKPSLNPDTLPLWNKSLHESFKFAFTFKELLSGPAATTFSEVQQTLGSVSKTLDQEVLPSTDLFLMTLQDPEQKEAILLRFSRPFRVCTISPDAVLVEEEVPMIPVQFKSCTSLDKNLAGHHDLVRRIFREDGMQHIQANAVSVEEVRFFLYLLKTNSTYLAPEYKAAQQLKKFGKEFTPSFLVPLRRLNVAQVSKVLSIASHCAVCGDTNAKRCAKCSAVYYCSRQCQVKAWPEHKKTCMKVIGPSDCTSTHVMFPLASSEDKEDCYVVQLSGSTGALNTKNLNTNIHGESRFLVKIQVPLLSATGFLMCYDRPRSFESHVLCNYDAYEPLVKKIREAGDRGVKGYFWAKREGPNLKVDLQELPPQKQDW